MSVIIRQKSIHWDNSLKTWHQKAQVSLLHNRNEVDDKRSFLLRKTFLVETFQWNFFVCSAELNCSTSVWPLFSSKASSKMAPQPKEWVGLYFMLSITHPHTLAHTHTHTHTHNHTHPDTRLPKSWRTLAHLQRHLLTHLHPSLLVHTPTQTHPFQQTHILTFLHTHTHSLSVFSKLRECRVLGGKEWTQHKIRTQKV